MTYTIMTLNGNTEIFGETLEIQERLAPTKVAQNGEEQVIPGVKGDSTMRLIPGVEYALVPYGNSRIWIRTFGFTYYTDGGHTDSTGKHFSPYYKDFGGEHMIGEGTSLEPKEVPILESRESIFSRLGLGNIISDMRLVFAEIL